LSRNVPLGCRQSGPAPSLLIRLNGRSGAELVEIIDELVKGRVVPFRDDSVKSGPVLDRLAGHRGLGLTSLSASQSL
jgi:hypothetical protein